jgi:hypothetical protein
MTDITTSHVAVPTSFCPLLTCCNRSHYDEARLLCTGARVCHCTLAVLCVSAAPLVHGVCTSFGWAQRAPLWQPAQVTLTDSVPASVLSTTSATRLQALLH